MEAYLKRELQKNFRKDVKETLQLISSKQELLDYQRKIPEAYVSQEIFSQWEDCFQFPKEQEWFLSIYTEDQFLALEKFNKEMIALLKVVTWNPPEITDFVETDEWKSIARLAVNTLEHL